jgi:hypothetical protein
MELTRPNAFFLYAVALTLTFTSFAIWRLTRRRVERALETREEFLTYPQTSPEIYVWLPYHKEDLDEGVEPGEPRFRKPNVGEPYVERSSASAGSGAERS